MVRLPQNENQTHWLNNRLQGDHTFWPWPWLKISRSNISWAISQGKMVWLTWKKKRSYRSEVITKYGHELWPSQWPWLYLGHLADRLYVRNVWVDCPIQKTWIHHLNKRSEPVKFESYRGDFRCRRIFNSSGFTYDLADLKRQISSLVKKNALILWNSLELLFVLIHDAILFFNNHRCETLVPYGKSLEFLKWSISTLRERR